MAQLKDYAERNTEIQKEDFLQQQREKGLGHIEEKGGGFGFLSKDMLMEKFRDRKKTTDFATRTKYYFEDATVMQAKAQRYRNLADNGRDIEAHANRFGNRSARKRKKSAVAAADAFDHAAALEEQYRSQMQEQDSVTQFQQKKEIMEARLLGMKKAAEVKSTSQENETYRMLKAEISCLSILKEQGQELEKQEQNAQQKEQLRAEIKKVRKDLVKAQQKLSGVMPSPQKQWMNQVYSETKVKAQYEQWKQVNPDLTEEDTRINMVLQQFGTEILKPEYTRALQALEKNGMYQKKGKPYEYEEGDNSRFFTFAIRAVMKDEHGQPINQTELEKDRHNKDWVRAIQTGDVELKNRVLMEQFRYVESLRVPSPREIRERGIEFYFEKDPALFTDLMRLGGMFDNLKEIDSFAKQYEEEHPVFSAKLKAIGTVGSIFETYMRGKHLYHPVDGVNDKSREELEELVSEDVLDDRLQSCQEDYDAAFKDPYGVGIDGVVLGYLNENEREALKLYAGSHPDEYDKEMRRKIAGPAEGERGREVLRKHSAEELSELTGEAYRALYGSTISKSKRMQRGENAVEKKKLQMALRNRMENCLIERQIGQAKALSRELYVKNKDGVLQENEKMKHVMQDWMQDSVSLQFAMDWPDIGGNPALLEQLNPERKSITVALNLRLASEALSKLDLQAFSYQSDREFVARLQENYRWIKRADSLRAYYRMAKEQNLVRNSSDFAASTLEAQLQIFEEMKADYDARIAMMNSPYYALLANADVSALSDRALQQKAEALRENDPELAEFLRNYRFLKNRGAAFQKGQSAEKRHQMFLQQKQEAEAARQETMLQQIEEFGMAPVEGETEEDYQKRIDRVLKQKAKENVPKVDGAFVKQKKPFLNNVVGNLRETELQALENWLEDRLADESALIEKGFTTEEIQELKALRQKSYQARWLVEAQEYFNDNLGKDWNKQAIESPQINGKVDEATNEMLNLFFNHYLTVLSKLGLPEDQAGDMTAEQFYSIQLGNITKLLAGHRIMFTRNWEEVLEKAKGKAERNAKAELEKTDCPSVTIGGKKYPLLRQMNSFKKYEGRQIDDKDRASLEDKLKQVKELCILTNAAQIINTEKRAGVYTTEFMALQNEYAGEIKKLTGEIDRLLKEQ